MSYIDIIKEKARSDRKTIVLPETNDKRTLIAASHISKRGLPTLLWLAMKKRSWMVQDGWKLI